MKNLYKTIIVFATTVVMLFGQNYKSISGKVIEKKTGEPLIGVNVYLSGTQTGTTTNAKGRFKLSKVKPGTYNLVASMIGYETENVEIEIKNRSINNLTFRLKEKIFI